MRELGSGRSLKLHGIKYTVGSRVRVQVSRVDLDGRKIDFRLVREGETDALVPRKPAAKGGGVADELKDVQSRDRAAKAARAKAVASRGAPAGKKSRGGAKPTKRSVRR